VRPATEGWGTTTYEKDIVNFNYHFDNVDRALPVLMGDLLADGSEFGSRAGRTLELMHVGITLSRPWQREITLPDRKANIAAQIVETMWVLAGRNDVAGLAPYLPRAADFTDDGVSWRAGYGPRLRNYHGVDQLAYVVDTLKESPGSRQAVATLWDPTEDTKPGKDIACNNWLSFSSRLGFVDLHVGIRSNDAMWGWSGINAFEWSVLLEVVAGLTGLSVGSLHFSTTSFHLYQQHWAKADRIRRNSPLMPHSDSPRLDGVKDLADLDSLVRMWFEYEHSIRTGAQVDADTFPEPMMRSWLRVLQWYWSGDVAPLVPLQGTRLHAACAASTAPAGKPQEPAPVAPAPEPDFLGYVNTLHAEKHAAYGDSWKRRGEMGILGNIARKVDRIGTGLDTSDETQADTAIDLLVYLAKMRCWLTGLDGGPADVQPILAGVGEVYGGDIGKEFGILEQLTDQDEKIAQVDLMMGMTLALAKKLWA
jgi:thymidylate synthase